MKSFVKLLIIIISINFIICNKVCALEINEEVKIDLLTMLISYEDITGVYKENNRIYFILLNGDRIIYDDGKDREIGERSCSSNIKDILSQPYPLGSIEAVMPQNMDIGRGRNYELLNGIYGSGEKNIYNNLKYIDTKAGTILFTGKNKGDIAIKNALNKSVELAESNPLINKFIYNRGGTFNYRKIQGTGNLSPHAYGIAIDLNKDERDYWKWVDKNKGSERICEYPKEMVKAFEDNGFIWGGKWNHFDSLHFEYRPEIILKAKVMEKVLNNNNNKWYYYFEDSPRLSEYINIINELDL